MTGSSGVLGQHILPRFLTRMDTQVLALHRQTASNAPSADNLRHETVDFSDRHSLETLFKAFEPTCLIHCAASGMVFPHVRWFDLVRFNVDCTLLLFELASQFPSCHFVHVSTGLAYRETGLPLKETDALENAHPYGASKAAADLLLRSAAIEFKKPLTVFRPFSFTGAGDGRTRLFPSVLRAALDRQPLALSPCDQIRDFCSADDIARAIVGSVERLPAGGCPAIFNLGCGRSITLRDLIGGVAKELGLTVNLEYGARSYGPFEPMHLVSDSSRAEIELGWRPAQNLAHAVWQLATSSFPSLELKEPNRSISW